MAQLDNFKEGKMKPFDAKHANTNHGIAGSHQQHAEKPKPANNPHGGSGGKDSY